VRQTAGLDLLTAVDVRNVVLALKISRNIDADSTCHLVMQAQSLLDVRGGRVFSVQCLQVFPNLNPKLWRAFTWILYVSHKSLTKS
jgi:hypothetical protein